MKETVKERLSTYIGNLRSQIKVKDQNLEYYILNKCYIKAGVCEAEINILKEQKTKLIGILYLH